MRVAMLLINKKDGRLTRGLNPVMMPQSYANMHKLAGTARLPTEEEQKEIDKKKNLKQTALSETRQVARDNKQAAKEERRKNIDLFQQQQNAQAKEQESPAAGNEEQPSSEQEAKSGDVQPMTTENSGLAIKTPKTKSSTTAKKTDK